MGFIELSEEDRKKYGAPERIPFEYGQWGLKSIDAMEYAPIEDGKGWTVEDLGNALRRKLLDEHGNVVTEPELDDDGNPVLDGAGNPRTVEVLHPRKLAIAVLVWLALQGIGIHIPWAEFDVQRNVVIDWSDQGKAPTPED